MNEELRDRQALESLLNLIREVTDYKLISSGFPHAEQSP